ncbi:MAG: TraR/DksA C4-type zinc finger protein, partial [Planctomycetes bacterium]|nr:TraR/DksA C4-type zinc finger protein [Planctomycetota bacterium]
PPTRPSERRLSKKEQADIKTFLMEKRERLLAGMRRELAMQRERADSKAADEVDKATDAYDEDLSFEIAVANDQELEEIKTALEKIDKGTYGECEVCGCSISPSRLKILPSATTCVACRGQEELARRRDDGAKTFTMLGEGDGEVDGEPL